MPRLVCPQIPGVPLHIVQRSRGGVACFRSAADGQAYLDALCASARHCACAVHAYVLMGNHVHLLATPARADGGTALVRALGAAAPAPWTDAFDATPVFGVRYLLACMRYIEWNPVRAGRVRSPEAYRWSSYRANALGENDSRVTPHAFYCALGRSTEARCAAYRAGFARVGELRRAPRRAVSAAFRRETGRAGTGS